MKSTYATLATATSPTMAAVIASPLSKPLTVGAAATGAGRDAGAGAVAAGREATGAALARGAAGAAVAGAPAGAGAAAGAADAPVGPPGGSVGSLIVGAAEGFGGKLMRTVSFFG